MNKKNQNISHYDLPIKEEYLKNIEITKHKTKRCRAKDRGRTCNEDYIFCSVYLCRGNINCQEKVKYLLTFNI